jgi:hypothetical protein
MCGGGRPPAVVQRDPKAEAALAAAEGAKKANEETALRKKRLAQSSLLATGAQGVTSKNTPTLLATAIPKTTLGA